MKFGRAHKQTFIGNKFQELIGMGGRRERGSEKDGL